MKLNYLKYIAGACLALTLSACYKDLGNYDYKDPDKVFIDGIGEYYTSLQGGYLEIIPKLGFRDAADDDSARYKYEWIAMKIGALVADKRKDLGNNKSLRINVNLPAGKYNVYYRILDTLTGLQWQKSFDIEVTSNIYEGWMLMTEVYGAPRVDMISKLKVNNVDVYTVQPDILTRVGSGLTLKGKPVGINCYRLNSLSTGYAIYLMTDQTTERVDAETFEYKSTMNIKYELLSNVAENFAPKVITSGSGGTSYMIEGTDAYYYEYVSNIRYSLPVNILKGEAKTFRVAPFLAPNAAVVNPMCAYYDLDNKRFVRQNGADGFMSPMPSVDTLFNYTTGKDLEYMTYTPFSNGNVFAILRDPEGSRQYLARFTIGANVKQVDYDTIPAAATDMNKATKYAVSPDFGYIFYTVGGKLYSYDVSLMSSKLMIDKGNEVFTQIRFRNSTLVVASYDPSKSEGANGTLATYTVQPVQGPLLPENSWSGVGKIVDFSYRAR
ncbi:PKD-like family lipoprotein [Paraflavitalea sp. CAU 1676]|uniref:PKD-like family lipoprotein n=1 Tax=Paraflavitalea sp. CAU 1676 TaxID=3032598 RepID=UPI0023D9FCEE|nr:PKD-like family lipoprotein [Paraflavitalea sp. CAU 1676]MDF2192829.1 PKD-like family lipoprotein [Paraflavitalea sp. CAU 1676]